MRKILFFLLFSFALHALSLTENGRLKAPAQELLSLFDAPTDLPLEMLTPYLLQEWMQANKERWEMDRRFEEKRDLALPLLRELQCIETIRAQKQHYSYALVLGATGSVMKKRLDFLYEEWERGVRFDQIILLTGARDLDPKIEEIPEGLQTETDLFVYLFDHHPLNGLVPHLVIDSPKQAARRPTTASTVLEWLKSNPKGGSCLAVSTQPFVGYQEAVVRSLLPTAFEVEAIGPQMGQNYPLSIYLDNFAKWLKYEQEKPSSEYLPYQTR
ncbi:MAG: hypothetical protein JSS30_02530 [Verrucomicrobia bacterium]|nr:hypothetical protein [Verrucomicrobiota bacterium]